MNAALTTERNTMPTYTHNGFKVQPVPSTYRRIAGGYCVDVRCSDPRTTLTSWTAVASDVVDQDGESYVPAEVELATQADHERVSTAIFAQFAKTKEDAISTWTLALRLNKPVETVLSACHRLKEKGMLDECDGGWKVVL